ncbi:MAG: SRPBCC domain-containing protein [Bacteroidetes bacterium]|nr:SRPBCC domain-containing protein [Bacteroidota bacterium]
MSKKDFTLTFYVNQSPREVFNAITNVRGWWSEALEGNSAALHDEFVYRHGDIHYSKHRLTEVVQDQKVVWLTLDSKLTFAKKQDEWNGTQMVFAITRADKTKLEITHQGLVPDFECFENCSKGWTYYLQNSLLPLITSGKGNPDKKA